MIKKTLENRKIHLFCDFHGHSRKKNIFIYGCNALENINNQKEKVFPLYFYRFLCNIAFKQKTLSFFLF